MRSFLVPLITRYGGAVHRFLYRASGGRVGGELWGLRIVLLTTTGRRSRKQRTVPLCSLRDGEDVVVIGSYGGLDRPPAWWLNLEAQPEAKLEDGRERRRVVARTAVADERARLWARVTAQAPGYLEYERRTKREIPIVILQPERGPSFVHESDGSLGAFCIYGATSPDKIREHAKRADLPATDIFEVVDTVIVRPDPQ